MQPASCFATYADGIWVSCSSKRHDIHHHFEACRECVLLPENITHTIFLPGIRLPYSERNRRV